MDQTLPQKPKHSSGQFDAERFMTFSKMSSFGLQRRMRSKQPLNVSVVADGLPASSAWMFEALSLFKVDTLVQLNPEAKISRDGNSQASSCRMHLRQSLPESFRIVVTSWLSKTNS